MSQEKIKAALEGQRAKIAMFADGYVDEVWEIVKSRTSRYDYTLYGQMTQFAERIISSGTGGVGLELVKKRRAFGGFTANIGYAAARLGVDTTMVGVYGKENLDPIFEPVQDICKVISMGDPAITHVFEFEDGKILMSHMEAVQDVDWKKIVDTLGMEKLLEMVTGSDLLGVGYWSNLPAFDEILTQLCEILPQENKSRFFFDFADFLKKDQSTLLHTLGILKSLNSKAPMTLSVNEHEAAALFAMYNETLDEKGRPISEKAEYVRTQLGLDEFVVHTPQYAVAAACGEEAALVNNRFCEKPIRSAGAGDTFNGGYIAARLAGLGIVERLRVANAAVSYFLRNAQFPCLGDMLGQMAEDEGYMA